MLSIEKISIPLAPLLRSERKLHLRYIILLYLVSQVYASSIQYHTWTSLYEQEKLPARVRHSIIHEEEFSTPDRLREALDVVEIVLGFLSSGGGKPEKPLGDYIDKTLKMKKRRFSQKVSLVELMHLKVDA